MTTETTVQAPAAQPITKLEAIPEPDEDSQLRRPSVDFTKSASRVYFSNRLVYSLFHAFTT
jgi:hypothetical protein